MKLPICEECHARCFALSSTGCLVRRCDPTVMTVEVTDHVLDFWDIVEDNYSDQQIHDYQTFTLVHMEEEAI